MAHYLGGRSRGRGRGGLHHNSLSPTVGHWAAGGLLGQSLSVLSVSVA